MIGTICDKKYRIIRLIGQGGMGSVYEALQLETDRLVALKCITGDHLAHGKTSVGRFQREAKAMSAIDTDHIARVLDAGVDPETGAPYMVMELFEGEDLQHLLTRVGKLEPDTALRITAQVCLGLLKAHEARVMHRDIKPANIFLARRGDGEIVVKILDFGIAKVKPGPSMQVGSTTGLTRTGGIVGSPAYMSPEQARGLSNIDYTTDLWSLGMVLYRALSGVLPHEHIEAFGDLIIAICSRTPRSIQSLAPWVLPEAAAVVRGALQLDVDARFPTATAMLDAIRPLLPDGWSLREEMLIPVSPATCARIAPKLPGADSPDDARRRLARITAHESDVVDGEAETMDNLAALNTTAPAPALVVQGSAGGSATTAEASVTTVEKSSSARRPTTSTGEPRARARWAAPLVVGLLATTGVIALRLSRAQDHRESSPPSEASTSVVAASAPPVAASALPLAASTPPVAAPLPALQRAKLVVLPADVAVEIDGKPSPLEGGKVEIEGAVGSRYQVSLRKGKQERTQQVIMTDTGISPDRVELEAAKPRAATPQGAPATTPRRLPPEAPTPRESLIPDKFE